MTSSDLAQRIKTVCLLHGEFVLRSGQSTNDYFDKFQFEADPVLLDEIAGHMASLVPSGVEVLAGLELGGIPIVTALGRHTGLPCAFVRKAPKAYGTTRLAEGAAISARRVLIVEDVVTTGGQIRTSSRRLRSAGAQITDALCVVDRQEGGMESLAAQGITLHSLFTRADLDGA